ncbi:MAG: transposase, partial [Vicinamibacteria bacterium]
MRKRFPTFGWKKIRDFLARFVGVRVSTGSVRKTLRAENLPRQAPPKRRRRRPPKVKTFERSRPGDLWQTDITYLYLPGDSRPLYLVAFLDDFSRYVVSYGLHTHMKGAIVIEALLEGILKFGRPKEVLSDQGRQYFAWRGKTDFQKLLRREGIEHVVARSHHPMTVGKTERFWATLKQEFWDLVRPKDLLEARERLSHFVLHYNHGRPHQSLEGLTPADRFFGASSEVKKAIEQAMDENEMRLALDQSIRKPVFLVGQIGDQSVSLHGERGRVVIQTGDGRKQEIAMEDLGCPEERESEESTQPSKEEDHAGGDDAGGRGGPDAGAAAPEAKAHEGEGAVALPGGSQGALGERVFGGEGEGAQSDGGDARD